MLTRLNISILLFVCLFGGACADKYAMYKPNYPFKSTDNKPDYSNLDYWAAHPWKKDPSDSIPADLSGLTDSTADVFFMHPTTFTVKMKEQKWNADIDDAGLNAKTDYSSILYQASVFNGSCRVFAPRYRQAHYEAFLTNKKVEAEQAFDLAYSDIKNAFEYYMKFENKGRPILIAGHSQGALHGLRLLKEFFEKDSKQLVAAYLIGWQIPKDMLTIPVCSDSSQTSCLAGWRTFRAGYMPSYVKNEKGNSWVTNPLTWTTDNEYVSRNKNRGSILRDFNEIVLHTTDAKIHEGVIWVSKPSFPGSTFYLTKNYHIGDINLFYMNLRQNVKTRIDAWYKTNRRLYEK